MLALLASVAPHASCEHLVLIPRGHFHQDFSLEASGVLPSLPHVRRLKMCVDDSTLFGLALPMPCLEELSVPEEPEMFAPFVSSAVGLFPSRGPPLLPALRRLRVATKRLILAPVSAPGLEHLSVTLHFPTIMLDLGPGTFTALTSLVRGRWPGGWVGWGVRLGWVGGKLGRKGLCCCRRRRCCCQHLCCPPASLPAGNAEIIPASRLKLFLHRGLSPPLASCMDFRPELSGRTPREQDTP
jgi:hypothetical protein